MLTRAVSSAALAATMQEIGAVAERRLLSQLQSSLPRVAARLLRWRRLGSLANSGLAPRSHPVLWFPFWIAPVEARAADLGFQTDLAYATLNGYCGIRLIDDVADGDHPEATRSLLPAAAYFFAQFQAEYAKYFDAGHAFWTAFHTAWQNQADSAVADANLGEVSRQQFDLITSHKCDAARIPIAAACFRYGVSDSVAEAWNQFAAAIAALHQMSNDILGWRNDLKHRIATYVLSTYRRARRAEETPEGWFRREGIAWATHTLAGLFDEAIQRGRLLGNVNALRWLALRRDAWNEDFATATATLATGSAIPDAELGPLTPTVDGENVEYFNTEQRSEQ